MQHHDPARLAIMVTTSTLQAIEVNGVRDVDVQDWLPCWIIAWERSVRAFSKAQVQLAFIIPGMLRWSDTVEFCAGLSEVAANLAVFNMDILYHCITI